MVCICFFKFFFLFVKVGQQQRVLFLPGWPGLTFQLFTDTVLSLGVLGIKCGSCAFLCGMKFFCFVFFFWSSHNQDNPIQFVAHA